MTDFELQLWLAARLPERILSRKEDVIVGFISQDECEHELQQKFRWRNTNNSDVEDDWFEVTEQEWLHVCWLIEQGLSLIEKQCYRSALFRLLADTDTGVWLSDYHLDRIVSASWQQRTRALIATLGETKGEK